MTTPFPAERQAPPQISDEIVEAFLRARDRFSPASGDVGTPLLAGLAAVYPRIEAEVRERVWDSRDSDVFRLSVALEDARRQLASREAEVRRLAKWIEENAASEISEGSAVDNAIRMLTERDAALVAHEAEVRQHASDELHAYADREYSGADDMATQEHVMRKAASIVTRGQL